MTASRSHKKKAAREPGTEIEELSFERALERLEQIVDQLEQGDLELEAALGVFEEGVQLSKQCASQLDSAERRIEILMEETGRELVRPFDLEEPGEGGERGEDD